MKDDSRFAERTSLNLITEVLCVALTTVIGLVMVPYYIDQLGKAAYAVVPLAGSVSSYMIIVANCFSNAINRYFVIALRKNDSCDFNRVYSSSMRLMLLIAAVMFPLTAVGAYLTPYVFDVPSDAYDSVRILFLCSFWSSILLNFGTTFNNSMVVYNKTYLINTMRSMYLGLQIILTIGAFLVFGARLEYIGYACMIGVTAYVVFSYVLMKRGFPDLKYDGDLVDAGCMKDIGATAFWTAVVRIGNLMFLQASLILSNLFLGAEEEAGFSLVVSMVSMVGTACNAVTNVFFPFYYRYYAEGDREGFRSIAVLGIKVLSLVVAMPLGYVCVFSPEVFTFWVGDEFVYLADCVWVMFILLIFNAVAGVLETIPTILLKVNQAAAITIATGVLNIVLAIVLLNVTDWGILSIAVAYLASMFLRNGLIFPVFVARIMGHASLTFLMPMVAGFAVFLCALGYDYAFSLFWDVQGTFVSIMASFMVMFVLFIAVAFRLLLTRGDKEMLSQALPAKASKIFIKLFC